MKTELDAAEGVKAVEETKEQIKEETAPKLQPKPVPNQEQLTETTNAEIVQDQKVKEEATNIFGVSDTELLTEEQKYLDGLQKGLDKEIQEYKAKEGDNFDKAEFQKFLDGKHKTITTKIRNGIVNGNIENINNIYKLGDDIVDYLLGDPTKIKKVLGWQPEVTFQELVKMMVENDLNEAEKELTKARYHYNNIDRYVSLKQSELKRDLTLNSKV